MANTTFNPSDKSANITLSGGNLIATATSGSTGGVRAIDKQVTGKFYWEVVLNVVAAGATGIASSTATISLGLSSGASVGTCGLVRINSTTTNVWVDGNLVSPQINLGGTVTNQLVCIAVDAAARLIWFRFGAAGNWNNSASANPATGVGGVSISLGAGIPLYPVYCPSGATDKATANFGDTAFTGTAPSGFTSGFTAGVTTSTNALVSQASVEHWITTNAAAQVTMVAVEQWGVIPPPPLWVTQAGAIDWVTNTYAPFRVTQVGAFVWVNTTAQSLVITGIPSSESVGSPSITVASGTITLIVTGIPSEETVGTPTFAVTLVLLPTGIPSEATVGTPTFSYASFLNPHGIPSTTTLGGVGFIPTVIVGIPSSESVGQPILGGAVTLLADWFVSSENYAAMPRFETLHFYDAGEMVAPMVPQNTKKFVLRCSKGGMSGDTEPNWAAGNNATTITGTATFKNVSGQGQYGWLGAAGDYPTLLANTPFSGRLLSENNVFVASDHHEVQTDAATYGNSRGILGSRDFGVAKILSVDRFTTQLTPGATFEMTGEGNSIRIENGSQLYHEGIRFLFSVTGTAAIEFDFVSGNKTAYFKNCIIEFNSNDDLQFFVQSSAVVFDNTQVLFSDLSQNIGFDGSDFVWLNTPHPFGGGLTPSILFGVQTSFANSQITLQGLDLSSMTDTLVRSGCGDKFSFENCKINPNVTRLIRGNNTNAQQLALINCDDGTHTISELWTLAGSVTTEFNIILAATDYGGRYSHKMMSSTTADRFSNPLCGFWLDLDYTPVGTEHTLTVLIISSTILSNEDVSLHVEYQGADGYSLFADSFVATPLTPATTLTQVFYAIWANSPPTPITQRLDVSFTQQRAGRVRCQVRLGRPSTTIYYDPYVIIG